VKYVRVIRESCIGGGLREDVEVYAEEDSMTE